MLGHILLPGSLGTQETMKRPWRVRREAVERPDGKQRWDRAFQAILSSSLENEQARAPGANASANGKEEYHEGGDILGFPRQDGHPKVGTMSPQKGGLQCRDQHRTILRSSNGRP